MKEIGGYFGLEQLVSDEYYKDLVSLNNGRSALLYILRARKIRKLYIPYYLCNSVSDMLKKKDYDFEYYSVDSQFKPIISKEFAKDEYLYIVNYFGQLSKSTISKLKKKFQNIIIDNTQAFFQEPVSNIDTLYSCRKFFGVPDGAYLSTDVKLNVDLKMDISKDRMTHILGRYENSASEYYDNFQNNDRAFKIEQLKYMSKLTHNILGAIEYDKVRKIRNENYAYIESQIGSNNKLALNAPYGAFAYPFYSENGIDIRKFLAKKKIYIPTLWPNVVAEMPEDSIEYQYAINILPLPCDQRYGIVNMKYLIHGLKEYFIGT